MILRKKRKKLKLLIRKVVFKVTVIRFVKGVGLKEVLRGL